MLKHRAGGGRFTLPRLSQFLAVALAVVVTGYIAWKVNQSGEQALQFAFNGLSVGAVYALLAIGFTLVYSTVWFFDLYYGAAAALGAYGVFYLRSQGDAYGFQSNELYVNIISTPGCEPVFPSLFCELSKALLRLAPGSSWVSC